MLLKSKEFTMLGVKQCPKPKITATLPRNTWSV